MPPTRTQDGFNVPRELNLAMSVSIYPFLFFLLPRPRDLVLSWHQKELRCQGGPLELVVAV